MWVDGGSTREAFYVGGCFARHVSVKRILPVHGLCCVQSKKKKSDLGLDCSGCQPRTFCSVWSMAASHRLEKMTQWELGLHFSHISTNDAKIGLFVIIYYCFASWLLHTGNLIITILEVKYRWPVIEACLFPLQACACLGSEETSILTWWTSAGPPK